MMVMIEIVLFITGVLAIAAGKVPSWLLGGAKYKYEGPGVRWLGLIFVLPLPLAFLGGLVLGLFLGAEGAAYAMLLEICFLVGAVIAAFLVGRRIRQPVVEDGPGNGTMSQAEAEALIAKKAQGSLIYAALGILGPVAFILCPLVLIRTKQALRLIDEHQVGEQHRSTASIARVLAIVILAGWSVVVAAGIVLVWFGSRL